MVTKDAVVAFCAHDAVPNSDAVTPFCTFKLPVIVVTSDESTTNIFVDPVATVNSAPEFVSVTVINVPVDPLTDNTVEPDLYMSTLPVTPNEPVICAEPVYGNAATTPVICDAVNAYDDDSELFEYDAVATYEAVCANVTNDAVCAFETNDAVAAYEADTA